MTAQEIELLIITIAVSILCIIVVALLIEIMVVVFKIKAVVKKAEGVIDNVETAAKTIRHMAGATKSRFPLVNLVHSLFGDSEDDKSKEAKE